MFCFIGDLKFRIIQDVYRKSIHHIEDHLRNSNSIPFVYSNCWNWSFNFVIFFFNYLDSFFFFFKRWSFITIILNFCKVLYTQCVTYDFSFSFYFGTFRNSIFFLQITNLFNFFISIFIIDWKDFKNFGNKDLDKLIN